jgi:hypothetical protein
MTLSPGLCLHVQCTRGNRLPSSAVSSVISPLVEIQHREFIPVLAERVDAPMICAFQSVTSSCHGLMSCSLNDFYLYNYGGPVHFPTAINGTLLKDPKLFPSKHKKYTSHSLIMKFASVLMVAAAAGLSSASMFLLYPLPLHRRSNNALKTTLKATSSPTTDVMPTAQTVTCRNPHQHQRSSPASHKVFQNHLLHQSPLAPPAAWPV